jgi:hypothetical protein
MSDGGAFTGTVTILDQAGNPAPFAFQNDRAPLTLGTAAAVRARLTVSCFDCGHRAEPDPAEMAKRYGAEMTVPDWRARHVCARCGSTRADVVVSGTDRRA